MSTFTSAGAGVLGDIGERFLGDAIEHRSFVTVEGLDAAIRRELNLQELPLGEVGDVGVLSAGINPRSSSIGGLSSRAKS
jgi:hypothetical protein